VNDFSHGGADDLAVVEELDIEPASSPALKSVAA
jgi:hypothetical protein